MKHTLLLVTVLTAFCSLPYSAAGDDGDWPQWRGPNRDGRSAETGLMKAWPEGGPPLVWKATGLGSGYSGVTLAGDRLFTMGEKENANFVIALNRADGKPLWTTQVGKAGAPGWGGFAGPRVVPTVDGDLLYAVGQYGEVVCLETATGKEVWRKDYIQDFGGQLPEWGYTGMPLVDGDQVILAPGGSRGNLVALNKRTGELVWQSKEFTDAIHYSSPIVAEIGGVRQYIQLTDASVAGIAAADGRMLWRAPRKGSVAVIPTPIYQDGWVYVTSGYGAGSQMFKITAADGKFSAEKAYDNKVMVNHHGGAVLIGKYVYGYSDGKGWTCQDFATGEMVWREKDKLGKGSLVYADGLLYCRAEDGKGTLVILEATPDGYQEKSRFDQPDRSGKNSWPHPVVAGGRLYIRDQDVLLCYHVRAQ
ncbi:MAG TPA: PQQ-like beta-propeller repeat protein [Candidatus Anammoximicrobium sp.]|nr:PQQ-like beta-propeller repeat protein [Candidatus Anammoximicrobium sp.]